MIIGLHGNKRAGKDTAYEFIKSAYPDAVRLAFADKIKESLAALFGVSIREINTLKEEKGVFKIQSESFQHSYTWRSFAQRYGTLDMIRKLNTLYKEFDILDSKLYAAMNKVGKIHMRHKAVENLFTKYEKFCKK